jgi:hypothetical protein
MDDVQARLLVSAVAFGLTASNDASYRRDGNR